jgi:predicted patatin/cPLA2 family phospholipase
MKMNFDARDHQIVEKLLQYIMQKILPSQFTPECEHELKKLLVVCTKKIKQDSENHINRVSEWQRNLESLVELIMQLAKEYRVTNIDINLLTEAKNKLCPCYPCDALEYENLHERY